MKKSCLFISCLILVFASSGIGQTSSTSTVETIRVKVEKYFASKKKVVVITNWGDKARGQIIRVEADEFAIRDQNGNEVTYQYSKVDKVNKSGGLSTGSIVGIAAGGVAGAIILVVLGKRLNS